MGGSIGNDHILSRTVLVVLLFLLRLSVVVPSSSLMLQYLNQKDCLHLFPRNPSSTP